MLTTQQVAVRLGITRSRVLQLIKRGVIPAERIGRDWMLDEAAVAAGRQRPKVGWAAGKSQGAGKDGE